MFLPLRDDNSERTITPWVTYALVTINVVCFLYELVLHLGGQLERFLGHWSIIPADYTLGAGLGGPVPWTILTSMFLHGGWAHLIGNMLYLGIFGDNVENVLGHGKYLFFYLACGVAGALAHILTDPQSTVPTLGASGAIAGVLGAYLAMFPRNRVLVWFFFQIIAVPAIVVIGGWAVLQFLSGAGSLLSAREGGGVAYLAHVGGFVAGLVLVAVLRPRPRPPVNDTWP